MVVWLATNEVQGIWKETACGALRHMHGSFGVNHENLKSQQPGSRQKIQTGRHSWIQFNFLRYGDNMQSMTLGTALRFTRARVKDPLDYSLANTLIPEASSCKYLGIILRSDLSWADQVNYTVEKAWKVLHFTMRIFKKGNSNTKSLAYISLVRPILGYGAACWNPYREGQITTLDRVQKKAAKFAHHTKSSN
jgi:hypothetical protein